MGAAGMAFGWHTERHPVLSRLDAAAQRRELERGVGLIARLTGQRSVPFCYPYGHPHTFTAETTSLLETLGYAMAFTIVPEPIGNADAGGRFALPRLDCNELLPGGRLRVAGAPAFSRRGVS
jgi:peptidoglycan/xylan/chitin deacetylase (PgdA/CDA1 family)